MLDFLPEQNKKGVKKEYLFRLLVVGLSLSLVCFLVALCLLIPSFMLSFSKEQDAQIALKNAKNTDTSDATKAARQDFEDFQKELLLLKPSPVDVLPSEVLAPVLSDLPKGIALTHFTYNAKADDKAGTLQIVGVANERSVLVSYVKMLKGEKLFSNVDYPLSNLAKEKDLDFTIDISGKF